MKRFIEGEDRVMTPNEALEEALREDPEDD
jgi:hypothetical protein